MYSCWNLPACASLYFPVGVGGGGGGGGVGCGRRSSFRHWICWALQSLPVYLIPPCHWMDVFNLTVFPREWKAKKMQGTSEERSLEGETESLQSETYRLVIAACSDAPELQNWEWLPSSDAILAALSDTVRNSRLHFPVHPALSHWEGQDEKLMTSRPD